MMVVVPLHTSEHSLPCEAINIYGALPSSGLQICDVADMYSSIRTVVYGSIRAVVCGSVRAIVCGSIRAVVQGRLEL